MCMYIDPKFSCFELKIEESEKLAVTIVEVHRCSNQTQVGKCEWQSNVSEDIYLGAASMGTAWAQWFLESVCGSVKVFL